METDDIVMVLFIIVVVVIVVGGLLAFVIYQNSEIDKEGYQQIEKWSAAHPKILIDVEKCLGTEKKITNSEYQDIEVEVKRIERVNWLNQLKSPTTQPAI